MMIRTQIYLPENIHQQLVYLARTKDTTISELLRKGAEKIIKEKRKSDESWKVMAKLATYNLKGLPKDLSKRHTEYYIKEVLGEK